MDPETVMMMAKHFEIGREQEHVQLEEPGSIPVSSLSYDEELKCLRSLSMGE
jgi:hypothetical protein